jgi:hypothetical protein
VLIVFTDFVLVVLLFLIELVLVVLVIFTELVLTVLIILTELVLFIHTLLPIQARFGDQLSSLRKSAGLIMIPLLVDPNTDTIMVESADIVDYLFAEYQKGETVNESMSDYSTDGTDITISYMTYSGVCIYVYIRTYIYIYMYVCVVLVSAEYMYVCVCVVLGHYFSFRCCM